MVRLVGAAAHDDPDRNVTVSIRLLPEVDRALRARCERRGDMSALILAALDSFVIRNASRQIPDMRVRTTRRITCIVMPAHVRQELQRVQDATGASRNAIINGALAAALKVKL